MAQEFEKYKFTQSWYTKDYTELLIGLLPDGIIWIFDRFIFGSFLQDVINGPELQDKISATDTIQDSISSGDNEGNLLYRLLSCYATEFRRLEECAINLINQSDPGVATTLLTEWERVLGLPETCFQSIDFTEEERQRIAHTKLFETAKTTNEQFYIDLADSLGFGITIEEIPYTYAPRIMGLARMGVTEPRMGDRGGYSIMRVTVNSGDSDLLLLQCVFNSVKQAHVIIDWIDAR